MSELLADQNFILANDAISARQWQLYISTDGGVTQDQIVQVNGTNPKIKKMNIREINLYVGLYAKNPNYIARLVKLNIDITLISAQNIWYVSFDNGDTLTKMYCVDILESDLQDSYWKILLAKAVE